MAAAGVGACCEPDDRNPHPESTVGKEPAPKKLMSNLHRCAVGHVSTCICACVHTHTQINQTWVLSAEQFPGRKEQIPRLQ